MRTSVVDGASPTRRANSLLLSHIARDAGIPLVVVNTFAPLVLSPARLGADIVVHSMTKFIGGASYLIGGPVCASNEFIGSPMDLHVGPLMILGPTMDPTVAASVALRPPPAPAHGSARRARTPAE